jgi:uncharacterized membrane protein
VNLERAVGSVLRGGVIVSSLCLALGLSVAIALGSDGTLARILLHTGIIVLLATPVARVVVSIVQYTLNRDWTFAGLTTIVFLELLASAVAALVFNQKL